MLERFRSRSQAQVPRTRAVTTLLPALLLVLLAGVAPAAAQQRMLALAPGEPAPEINAYNTEGKIVPVTWTGRISMVNFWATWCQPCRLEMPALEELHKKHDPAEFQVVGLTREITQEGKQADFIEQVGVTYPYYVLDKRWPWPGVNALPTSFLIDREGKILRKYVGTWDAQLEGMARDVEDALAGRPLQTMVPRPENLRERDPLSR